MLDRSDKSLLGLAFLLIVTALLWMNGAKQHYETHTPYADGVLTTAVIISIFKYRQGRGTGRHIDVTFTSQDNRKQQARLEGNGNEWLKVGNVIEISYLPGNDSEYRQVRWPAGRQPDSEYYGGQKIHKRFVLAGILCILLIPVTRLFRRKDDADSTNFETKTRYFLPISFGRVLFNVVVYTGFFGLLYVCAYLYLFQLTGLSLATSQILMAAISALFFLAFWNAIRPAIGHHPLVLTRRGFSIYNSGEIPWREVSEIMLFRGHKGYYALRFYLSDESRAEPRLRSFGRVLNPPHMGLSLEPCNWDEYELKEELIYFALRDRDNDAASTLRRPPWGEHVSTGPISWPENMNDSMERSQTKADIETGPVSSDDSGTNSGTEKPAKQKSGYMSSGFHLRNH